MATFAPEPFDLGAILKLLICETCGTQFPASDRTAITTCRICDDPRQFVPPSGQSFTTLADLHKTREDEFTTYAADPRITFIQSTPKFAIGQRAILIQTPAGNVLWDCITVFSEKTVDQIKSMGPLQAIVISHPHFYSTHVQWARAFECPVYLAAEDKEWTTMDSSHQVMVTETETEIIPGVKAIKLGGHFPGSMVLSWDRHLFIADTLMTTAAGMGKWEVDSLGATRTKPPSLNTFSFLYSIPNYIPLNVEELSRMWGILRNYDFQATHGGFAGMDIEDQRIKERVLESMKIQARHMGHGGHEFMNATL
ncbi:Fc.00g096080.m01.CDS01 [Cosmosporella sp. VM-42]